MNVEGPASLIGRLSDSGGRFLVIGGIASVAYGVRRATFDLDLLVPPRDDCVDVILGSLRNLGGYDEAHRLLADGEETELIGPAQSVTAQQVLDLGALRLVGPLDVDLIMAPSEEFFDFLWQYRKEVQVPGGTIPLPSLLDLIRLKESQGRQRDLEDARALRWVLASGGAKK